MIVAEIDNGNVDYVKTAVSLSIAALSSAPSVLLSVFPYVTILAAFGGFVLWNQGVVLGECQHR